MKASGLLAEIDAMHISSESVKDLARRVIDSDGISGIVDIADDIVATITRRAMDVSDEATMAGLIYIAYACGLETTRELVCDQGKY